MTDELERTITTVATAIRDQFHPGEVNFRPGKFDLWLRFVRLDASGEREAFPARKVQVEATNLAALLHEVASQVVLAVFGQELMLLPGLPNLRVTFLQHSAVIHLPDAPDPDAPDQIQLRLAVAPHQPGLWQQLFNRPD